MQPQFNGIMLHSLKYRDLYMSTSAYGQPFIILNKQEIAPQKMEAASESEIQDFIFNHPQCLPITEINDAYTPLLPVCMELSTTAGPLDILMITPRGKIVIIETKLWRNPEARRKVVAQILDYAKELAKWQYEDLQREVNKRLKTSGNHLYRLVRTDDESSDIGEAAFVDAVSRNLRKGEFLLLIVGDGIREGAESITEFLSNSGNLAFSLAMVELALYKHELTGLLVVPRIITKTVELQRYIVEIPAGFRLIEENDRSSIADADLSTLTPEQQREKEFYPKFWQKFINNLSLDDPGQPIPEPNKSKNQFFYLPPRKQCWISAYFMRSNNRVGVYFRCSKTQIGQEISEKLEQEKKAILSELGEGIIWDMLEESGGAGVRMQCIDVFAPENQQAVMGFFSKYVNLFVNAFRPRVKRIADELGL